ncbi:MAG: tRNA (adenosine(37)-N6)-threonylcarbamoyltransferase complex dimerization subunit type 1 TsaB [Rickettsiales bacterium]|nr:tRNA (adenosine(37)-N6)-threonylcarbamoyltransferase complex dimerization subunit type 1 TsaB [Rickettsiales bacterium]
MNILSIDTATSSHSIALSINDQVSMTNLDDTTQSDLLFFEINSLLQKANVDYKDLDRILCTIGPGSFTGIRIGISAIRGIKATLPTTTIVGFTTLEIMAFAHNQTEHIHTNFYTTINAFSDELYVQQFDYNTLALSEILVLPKSSFINNQTSDTLVSNDNPILTFFNNKNIDTKFIQYNATTLLEYHKQFPERTQQVKPLYIKKPNIHHGAFTKS